MDAVIWYPDRTEHRYVEWPHQIPNRGDMIDGRFVHYIEYCTDDKGHCLAHIIMMDPEQSRAFERAESFNTRLSLETIRQMPDWDSDERITQIVSDIVSLNQQED